MTGSHGALRADGPPTRREAGGPAEIKVQLRVPDGASPGMSIQAIAPGGLRFTTYVPTGLSPGQSFFVRVPTSGDVKTSRASLGVSGRGGESPSDILQSAAEHAAKMRRQGASSVWDSLPAVSIGNFKYLKDTPTCSERCCDMRGYCCPWVRYTAGGSQMLFAHTCCCAPCCGSWVVESDGNPVGSLATAGCCDQPPLYMCCPCLYWGEVMQVKFRDPSGRTRFTVRRRVRLCQYLCVCGGLMCNPFIRCHLWCCTDKQYVRYQQLIYGADMDDPTVRATLTYVERLTMPCVRNERVRVAIDVAEHASEAKVPMSDLAALSIYPFLLEEGNSALLCFPYCLGVGMYLPTPSGIQAIDEPNSIRGQWMDRAEALELRHRILAMK